MRKNSVLGGVVVSGIAFGAVLTGGVPATADPGTGSVTGRVWFDRDANGVQDAGEPGYDWAKTISVMKGDQFVGYFDTDAEGRYSVTGLAAGTYRVGNMQSGVFAETTPAYQDITIDEGGKAEADFGMRGGVLFGTLSVDDNADGLLGDDEGRLSGKTVKMVGPAGLTGETTTSDAGEYRFEDLPNGSNYHIVAPQLPDLVFSPAGDVDLKTGESPWGSIWRGSGVMANAMYVAPVDFAVGKPKIDANHHKVGDEFEVKIPVTNKGKVADKFTLTASYSEGLVVTGVTGASGVGMKDVSDEVLEPGKTTTVTVRFRADGRSDGELLFQVYGANRPDTNAKNDISTVPLTVTVEDVPPVQEVANTVPAKKAASVKVAETGNLASTGASPVVPLVIGAGLLLAGAGTLFFLRRRGARG